MPLLQRTLDVHGAEHDRLQPRQGTLDVNPWCVLPATVVPVQHDVTQRCQRAWPSWFSVCRRRRIYSGFAVLIIVLLTLDTALLAALHELLAGVHRPRLSKSFLACVTASRKVNAGNFSPTGSPQTALPLGPSLFAENGIVCSFQVDGNSLDYCNPRSRAIF